MCVCVCVCMRIKMNRPANEFELGILGFHFIYLSTKRVSDFIVLLRRIIMARVVAGFSFYSEEYFNRGMILNS